MMNKKTIILIKVIIIILCLLLAVILINGYINEKENSNPTIEINGLKFTVTHEYEDYTLNEFPESTEYIFNMNGSSITVFSNTTQYENMLSHYKNRTHGLYMEKFTNQSTKTIKGKKVQIFSDNNGTKTYFFKINNLGVVFEYHNDLNINPETTIASSY